MKTKDTIMAQNELASLRAELKEEKKYSAHLGNEVEKLTEKMITLHSFFSPLLSLGKKLRAATNTEEEYNDWKSGRMNLYRSHGRF